MRLDFIKIEGYGPARGAGDESFLSDKIYTAKLTCIAKMALVACLGLGLTSFSAPAEAAEGDVPFTPISYYPYTCKYSQDASLPSDPRRGLNLSVNVLRLEGESLFYSIAHRIVQCRYVDGVLRFVPVPPPPEAAFLILNYRLGHAFSRIHDYERDQFGGVAGWMYVSTGTIPLKEIMTPREYKKFQNSTEASGYVDVRVGYNVLRNADGSLLSFERISKDFHTGFFEIRFRILADRRVVVVSP
jgi:hypothetical protein